MFKLFRPAVRLTTPPVQRIVWDLSQEHRSCAVKLTTPAHLVLGITILRTVATRTHFAVHAVNRWVLQ